MLSIKPTSVECESVFSKAAKFMSKTRCSMKMSTMDMCISLNINYDLFELTKIGGESVWKFQRKMKKIVSKLIQTSLI